MGSPSQLFLASPVFPRSKMLKGASVASSSHKNNISILYIYITPARPEKRKESNSETTHFGGRNSCGKRRSLAGPVVGGDNFSCLVRWIREPPSTPQAQQGPKAPPETQCFKKPTTNLQAATTRSRRWFTNTPICPGLSVSEHRSLSRIQ